MQRAKYFSSIFLLSLLPLGSESMARDGFVLIQGASFQQGDVLSAKKRPLVRVEDFEILDHPVSNKEYKAFIMAENYPPPPHWKNGEIPAGKEDYPVIYVDRNDAETLLKWMSERDHRLYRLPTYAEFEYASRGGLVDKKYPWGDENPSGRANYAQTERNFAAWQDFLKPAVWGEPNGYGLYGMAGNTWAMVTNNQEPASSSTRFRIENPAELERIIIGGSWARSEEYLRCGYHLESYNFKHPDMGIRPVRESVGSDWKIQPRKLCALPQENRTVFLSWASLETDDASTRFNIYRLSGKDRYHAGFRINEKPVVHSSIYIDNLTMPVEQRYQYYIRPVDAQGKEGIRSEWYGMDPTAEPTAVITTFKPIYHQGSLTPVFGDLDGDGVYDGVIRMDNGNIEASQDPGLPVQLEAFTSYGKSLWRKDVCSHARCYGSANNNPFNVWDMTGDGRAEVITRLQMGDQIYLAILDGLTGEITNKVLWPPMVSDTQRSSTRILLSIAYLDGKQPSIITQTGVYENEVLAAFDAKLNRLWQYQSFTETSGSGSHKIEVADVDGDGKMEIFDGTTCLNHDGTLRWSIYKMHADLVDIYDFLPKRKGLEVCYNVESSIHAGIYMADAGSGEIIWKFNREQDPRWTHAHYGWTADIWEGSVGLEHLCNRGGSRDTNLVLYSSGGHILLEPFPFGYIPLEWDGDPTQELISRDGKNIFNFDGKRLIRISNVEPNPVTNSAIIMVADLYGDSRDELVILQPVENNKQAISVVMAVQPFNNQSVTKTCSADYRLWLSRNMGGGYPTHFNSRFTIFLKPEGEH